MAGPRMPTLWQGSVAELLTLGAAIVALPFYLGVMHASIPLYALYAGVAGSAMATGEFLEYSEVQHGGIRLLAAGAVVWVSIVGLFGSPAYLLAFLV